MINAIPILGWFIALIGYTSMSIPFWFFWTYCGVGREYFYFVPARFHVLPLWDVVGLFFVMRIAWYVAMPVLSITHSGIPENQRK